MSILRTPSPSDVNTIKTRVTRAEQMNSEEEYRAIYSLIGSLPSDATDITMIDHSGDNYKLQVVTLLHIHKKLLIVLFTIFLRCRDIISNINWNNTVVIYGCCYD